ncbi:MAG: hypothetical protein ACLP0J_01585 [Solirubrobacteraceae bacterium]
MKKTAVRRSLLRTHFWDTPVEDNAALILGDAPGCSAPLAMLHVTWTEWKNLFSIEVCCRTAKLQVDGLLRSHGPQSLRIYRMSPALGPPALDKRVYGSEDLSWSWELEWDHFAAALTSSRQVDRSWGLCTTRNTPGRSWRRPTSPLPITRERAPEPWADCVARVQAATVPCIRSHFPADARNSWTASQP